MGGVSGAAPTAHVSGARLILTGLRAAEADRAALAARAGLPAGRLPGTAGRVPTALLTRLWQLGRDRDADPSLGVEVAARWSFGRLHLGDHLFGTAADLAEAVDDLVRHAAWLNTAANEVRLARHADGSATLTYQVRSGDPAVDATASQFALATQLFRARHMLGRRIRPLRVSLASAAPPHHREVVDGFDARRLDFGAGTSTMTFSAADLAAPLPGADPELRAVLLDHAERAGAPAGPGWVERVRPVVRDGLAAPDLSLSQVARRLAVSPRSLQRRLDEEGTTWRELVDGVRRERAEALLARGLTRAAVARRLGFGDPRALRAALRRWGASG
jgi:AraC-like DNA-binding protein